MFPDAALSLLAHRRQPVRLICADCGWSRLESSSGLVARFGPLFPLCRVADYAYCDQCGGIEILIRLA